MYNLTKFQLLRIIFFSIFIFGIGLSFNCENQLSPCDFEDSQSLLIVTNVMIILGLTIPFSIWIISSRIKLFKKLRSLKISYGIGIIGIGMFFLIFVFGYFDVKYNTDFMDNDNELSHILWSMHNHALHVLIFAGIVFLLELRHRNKNHEIQSKSAK